MGESLGYVRTSTSTPQPHEQHAALGAAGCTRTWLDHHQAGRGGQPQLAELVACLRPGDEVVVCHLDRLARSLPQLVAVAAQIDAAGASLRSLGEDVSTAGEGGADARRLLAHLREFQLTLGRESTRAGLEAARTRGSVGGRPSVMTPGLAEAARAALSRQGATVASVARDLGVSRTTLYRHEVHAKAGAAATPARPGASPPADRGAPALQRGVSPRAGEGDDHTSPSTTDPRETR